MSTSTLGIVGTLFIFGMLFMNLKQIKNLSSSKRIAIGSIFFIGALFLLIWTNTTTNPVITRILNGSTSGVRITRSYELFEQLPLGNKIFGIGIQNQELYLNYNNIILNSDTLETTLSNREFAATIGYLLCTTGVVGLGVFLTPFLKLFMKYDYRMKIIIMLFGLICFSCCVFARSAMCVFLVLVFATKELIDSKQNATELSRV